MKTLPIILLVVLFISAVSYTSPPLFNNIRSNRPPPAAIATIEPAAVSIIPIESSPSGNPQALMSALINYCAALLAVTVSLLILFIYQVYLSNRRGANLGEEDIPILDLCTKAARGAVSLSRKLLRSLNQPGILLSFIIKMNKMMCVKQN